MVLISYHLLDMTSIHFVIGRWKFENSTSAYWTHCIDPLSRCLVVNNEICFVECLLCLVDLKNMNVKNVLKEGWK
jgi:hypothetical protein